MVTGLVWLCLCHVPLSRLLLTACFSCRIACCTAYMPILSPRAVADAAAVVVSSPLTAGWLSSFTVGSDQQLVCAAGSPALLYTCCCRRQARSCVLSLHSLTAAANSQQQPLHDAGCPAALHTMQLVCAVIVHRFHGTCRVLPPSRLRLAFTSSIHLQLLQARLLRVHLLPFCSRMVWCAMACCLVSLSLASKSGEVELEYL